MKSGIYQIRNLINGKVYVGSFRNLKERWGEHKRLLRSNRLKHHSPHLQHAWNKYGEENFIFEILIHCRATRKTLLCYEQKYMDFFCSYEREFGYNVSRKAGGGPCLVGAANPMFGKKGALAPMFGRKRTAAEKERISKAQCGELGNNHKLTWATVKEIRELCRAGKSYSRLAKIFNVSVGTIEPIIQNKTWKDESYTYVRIGNAARMKRGEEHHEAKLTWLLVREIREKYVSGNFFQTVLAEEYGVSRPTIRRVLFNKFWKDETLGADYLSKVSEVAAKKKVEINQGRTASEETKKKLSDCNRGEKNHNSKLTWFLAREIRRKYSLGDRSQRDLAKEYDVNQFAIHSVTHNRT